MIEAQQHGWTERREGLEELYASSGGGRLGLGIEEFGEALLGIAEKYLGPWASHESCMELFRGLKLADLALARACAAGSDRAWNEFMARFREPLYEAALSICREPGAGRELADSLYADLYGTTTRDGQRRSKLSHYNGRGSLEGWLRSVLAQAHVDRFRQRRRLVSLEEEEEQGRQFVAAPPEPAREVGLLESAVDGALAMLDGESRLLLAWYYVDGKKLAEIGTMMGVHESTVSRRLEKVQERLRKEVRRQLREGGQSKAQIEELLAEADVRDVAVDLGKHLAQGDRSGPFSR